MRTRTICATLIAVATTLVGGEAFAQDWSLHGGETVKSGDLIAGEFGWPDASFQWDHSMSHNFDAGIRFSLIYGAETTVRNTAFGLGFLVPLRFEIAHSGKLTAMVMFSPGLKVYPDYFGQAEFGPAFPVAVQFGIRIIPEGEITFGGDFNMWLDVTAPRNVNPVFVFAPEFGPGFEYHIDHNLGVGINMRFGPVVATNNFGGGTEFGMVMQAGLMYHL